MLFRSAVHDKAQLTVVHIHAALPGDAAGIDVQGVALLDAVVDQDVYKRQGKTTLIRILTGLQQPTSGQYSLYGVPHTDPDILRCRRRMGAVVETLSLIHISGTVRDAPGSLKS